MGRDFVLDGSVWAALIRSATKVLAIALVAVLIGAPANMAQAGCTSCVRWYSATQNDTGGTASQTLTVSMTVPDLTACPDAVLVAVLAVVNPGAGVPEVATVTWDVDPPGSPTELSRQGSSSGVSSLAEGGHLRSEIWTLILPPAGTGTLTFDLGVSNSARMSGGGVILCGVDVDEPIAHGISQGTTVGNSTADNKILQSATDASGRMFVDHCAIYGNRTAATRRNPEQTLNWNERTGTSTSDVLSASSRVAMVGEELTYGYTFNTAILYVCSAISFIPNGVTAVGLEGFTAKRDKTGVALAWQAGQEANNLGYRLFREDDGERVLVTPEMIAGSALSYPGSPLEAGYSYAWWDPDGRETSKYLLADVELGGRETVHGPFATEAGPGDGAPVVLRTSRLISTAGEPQSMKAASVAGEVAMRPVLDRPAVKLGETNRSKQRVLAAGEAAKVVVRQEGWYRLTGAEIAAAGVGILGSDSDRLQLFANGTEQAIRVNDGGDRTFDSADSVEFYGVPLDTQCAGTQTYWLIRGSVRGERIPVHGQSVTDGRAVTTSHTAELKERLFYAGGVLNGDAENVFGRVVTSTAAAVTIGVPALEYPSQRPAGLEVALQGFSEFAHEVQVSLNGKAIGVIPFSGKERKVATFSVPAGGLIGLSATVAFKEIGNTAAVSAVDFVRVSYPRISRAQQDKLFFSMTSADVAGPVRISGFTGPSIRVFDVTAPDQVSEVRGAVPSVPGLDPILGGGGYSVDIAPQFVRWQGPENARHFLAVADGAVMRPVSITANLPSNLGDPGNGATYVVIAHRSLMPALTALKMVREAQGLSVAIVDVEDVYDEFGFGVKSPYAIREFLRSAASTWTVRPRFALLVGDASQDPRDYLGRGQDLVPTKLVDTKTVETASDDWMADFDEDGKADIALGRLPAETEAEAVAMASKIVHNEMAGRTIEKALFVADTPVLSNFAVQNRGLRSLLPSSIVATAADARDMGDAATRAAILEAVSRGVDLLHYSGHGTIDHWRGNLLSVSDVPLLKNSDRLPIFTVTNCLTGIFQEPLLRGLGEVLMKAPGAGAVAVWASSGTTEVAGQEKLMSEFVRSLSGEGGAETLGDAVRRAKAAVTDADVRNTWILLGDPATRIR